MPAAGCGAGQPASEGRRAQSRKDLGEDLLRFARKRIGDGEKFEQIDPPLAALIGGDKGLRLAQARGKLVLGDAGLPADLGKTLAKCDVSLL